MAGRCVALQSPQVTFGSIANNDVVLSDPAISQQHMVIVEVGGSYLLKDLGSTNGIYVNGVRANDFVLASDDVLTIGNIEALVQFC